MVTTPIQSENGVQSFLNKIRASFRPLPVCQAPGQHSPDSSVNVQDQAKENIHDSRGVTGGRHGRGRGKISVVIYRQSPVKSPDIKTA